MTSFLSRMANEASAALSDAYGHLMHGDDAGSAAKVVWVIHPTNVPIEIQSGNSETAAAAAAASAAITTGEHKEGVGGAAVPAANKFQQSTKSREDVVGVGVGAGAGASSTSVASPGRNNSSPYLFTQKFGERVVVREECKPPIFLNPVMFHTHFLLFVRTSIYIMISKQ